MKHSISLMGSTLRIGLTTWLLLTLCLPVVGQNNAANGDSQAGDSLMIYGDGSNDDSDYDALIQELYGEEKKAGKAAEKEGVTEAVQTSDRPTSSGPAPGLFKTTSRLHGYHLAINGVSPFATSEQFYSWYSYIDVGVSIKLPYEVYVESIPLYFVFEISSFNFENSYPEGGNFSGLSYIFQATAIGDQSGAAVGFGFWEAEMGSMLELNYRFRPTKNTFLRFGTRGVLITNIEEMGAVWWAELRISTGLEL